VLVAVAVVVDVAAGCALSVIRERLLCRLTDRDFVLGRRGWSSRGLGRLRRRLRLGLRLRICCLNRLNGYAHVWITSRGKDRQLDGLL